MPAPTAAEVWTTFIRLVDKLNGEEIVFLLDEYKCDLQSASAAGHTVRGLQLELRIEWLTDAYFAIQDQEQLRF